MRQLEATLGEQPFRDGLREYLKRYAFGNATWLDLVRILDARTPENVAAWSRAWVEERGRPEFTTALATDARGRIASLTLTVNDPLKRGLVWPQRIRVALGYDDSIRLLPVTIAGRVTVVRAAAGLARPRYVLAEWAAGSAMGCSSLMTRAARSCSTTSRRSPTRSRAAASGSRSGTICSSARAARVIPGRGASRAPAGIRRAERAARPELRRPRVLEVSAGGRTSVALRRARGRVTTGHSARGDAEREGRVVQCLSRHGSFPRWRGLAPASWRRDERVPGLTFAEPDEITMAMELAVREVPNWKEILDAQLVRTQNPDRRARFAFVMPALSADPAVREQAFARFNSVENRRREPWVLESVAYLNHPLRAAHAQAVRAARPRTAGGDQADRRHLFPEAMDGRDARRASLVRGGGDGAGVSRGKPSVSGTAAVDDPEFCRRTVPRALKSGSTLNPEPGFSCAVVGPADVPVLPERVVVHRRDEIERRLELDVIEARFGGDQLMPFAGRDQHEAPGADRQAPVVVLHFARAGFNQVEVLRHHRARLRGVVNVPRRMGMCGVIHPAKLEVPGARQPCLFVHPEGAPAEALLVDQVLRRASSKK